MEEDAEAGIGAEGLRLRTGPLSAAELSATSSGALGTERCCPLRSGNSAVKDITSQLKAMDARSLGGDAARELIERRDIEDVLFST